MDDEASWHAGSRAQRRGYLRALRRRDPAAGRTLLEADWSTLGPDERIELLASLADGLGPSDEALLERALDDRRKEVRSHAADLLAALPDSAYRARMTARARASVSLPSAGPTGLTVTPPSECDASMRRDGVSPKPPAKIGERAWWLEEILARTPVSIWPLPAADFVSRAAGDDFAAAVHRGLARAAASQREPEWAAATLDVLGDTPWDRECAAALHPVLPAAELVRRVVTALDRDPGTSWDRMLAACPVPWPPEVAAAVMRRLLLLRRRPELAGDLYRLCRLAAVRMPVGASREAQALAEQAREEGPPGARSAALDHLATVLSYRHEMIQELQ